MPRPVLFKNFMYLFLLEDSYNIVIVFAMHQHELAIGVHGSPPVLNFLPPPSPPDSSTRPALLIKNASTWTAVYMCVAYMYIQVALVVKNPPADAGVIKKRGFNSWVWKTPWRKAWQPTPVFMPGESHGERSLASYSP